MGGISDVSERVKDAAETLSGSEEGADITVNINVISPDMPPEIAALGHGVHVLHEETDLRVQRVDVHEDEYPPRFQIDGAILHDNP